MNGTSGDTAIAGSIGNAAYGFDTIHQSLGDTALVDQTGAAILEPGVSVTRRTTRGGAGPVPVAAQLERFRARLADDARRVADA